MNCPMILSKMYFPHSKTKKWKEQIWKNSVTKSHYRNFAWYLTSSVSVLTFWGGVQCSSILANLDCKKLMNFESHQTVKCILYINQYSMMFQTSEEVDGSDVWVHNLRNSKKWTKSGLLLGALGSKYLVVVRIINC